MPTIKLTQLAAERQKFPTDPALLKTSGGKDRTSITYWHSACPGFGLRVSSSGRKTWIAMYRVKGKAIMETLGVMPKMDFEQARKKADQSFAKVNDDINPVEERRAAEEAAKVKPFTFSDLAERYLTEHCERNNKPGTVYQTRKMLDRVGETMGRSRGKGNRQGRRLRIAGSGRQQPYA
jgi:hypothetical protein